MSNAKLNRRSFLGAIAGAFTVTAGGLMLPRVAEALIEEPRKRVWQVSRDAPFGARFGVPTCTRSVGAYVEFDATDPRYVPPKYGDFAGSLEFATLEDLKAFHDAIQDAVNEKFRGQKVGFVGHVDRDPAVVTPSAVRQLVIAQADMWTINGWLDRGGLEKFARDLEVSIDGKRMTVSAQLPVQEILFADQPLVTLER